MNLEDTLRHTLETRLDAVPLSPGDPEAARRTGVRMRVRRRVTAGAVALAVVAAGATGSLVAHDRRADGPSGQVGQWRRLPTPPLSPRADAVSVWTGSEVVVVGGDTQPCPPSADCAGSSHELRDGAAYDPATDTWHRIAPAPVPVGPGDQLLAADGIVVLHPGGTRHHYVYLYDPANDEWDEVLASATSSLSAYGSTVYGLDRGLLTTYDVRVGVWDERTPRDRIRPRLTQRRVTATGIGPVVTGLDATQPNDGRAPSVVLADVWDGTSWHRLPATGQLGNDWFWTGTEMVDADPTTVDGGEVDPYPHAYPSGGILDVVSGRWTQLPADLVEGVDGWGVTAQGGRWAATYGQVYDTETGRVRLLPTPDGAPDQGVTAAWADGRLLAFGGLDSSLGHSGAALTNHAWLYTP